MHETLALGAVAVGGLLLANRDESDDGSTEQATEPVEEPAPEPEPADAFEPVTNDGEVGVSDGVVHDDPETGTHNDEAGDDTNASFESIGLSGDHAENYAPDTQDGSTAPSGGVISDTGDSMTWGDATEDENDDVSQRTADSEMSDSLKSAFDRYANRDSPDY